MQYCFLPLNYFKKRKMTFLIKFLSLFCMETPKFWFSNANMAYRNLLKYPIFGSNFPNIFTNFFPGENIGLYKTLCAGELIHLDISSEYFGDKL